MAILSHVTDFFLFIICPHILAYTLNSF